jgi:hypothetical protein
MELNTFTPEQIKGIRTLAERELLNEAIRIAIDAEKARLKRQTPWSRFVAWLPFTIHRRSK